MNTIARVIKTENGDEEEIIQTVEAHYGENKYCDQFSASGDDSPPLPEDRVAIMDIEGTGNSVSVGVLSKSQGAKPGEKLIYSRDEDGNVVAKIHLKNDGSVLFEGEKDAELTVKGDVNITVNGNAKFNIDKDAEITAKNITLKGNIKVTGGTCEIGGTATPSGSGSLCALPYCAFTGAPQAGKISSGN